MNPQCSSSMNYPTKNIRIDLDSYIKREPLKYRVTLVGTKGYGIDYGVCTGFDDIWEEATEDNLGEVVLKLLSQSYKLWEDSVISVKRID